MAEPSPAKQTFRPPTPDRTGAMREIFWQDVIREMLLSLAVLTERIADDLEPKELLDGRFGIILQNGSRIPIGGCTPLFAAGVGSTPADRAISVAVECSVFEIITPGGEVFTLPISEVRAFHALTPALLERMKRAMRKKPREGEEQEPFGFAAFTSMAKRAKEAEQLPAPEPADESADDAPAEHAD